MHNSPMPTVSEVLDALQRIAPSRWAFEFDRVGLQLGDALAEVTKVAVSLDRSLEAVAFAKANGCQMLIAHHPLFFPSVASVTTDDLTGKTALALMEGNIAFAAAHTNWDCAPGGINDALAQLLELQEAKPFGSAAPVAMSKFVFTAPEAAIERCIDACAELGAGTIGHYQRCAFQGMGQGTYEPLPGASPAIGKVGARETVREVRVEMSVRRDQVESCRRGLSKVHPYEEPVIDCYRLDPVAEMPIGRIGRLRKPQALAEFAGLVERRLSTRALAWGDPDRPIACVAVVGGAADREYGAALAAGADLLVTGEVKQHVALECQAAGMCIMSAGHYATEQPGVAELACRLSKELPDLDFLTYVPAKGQAGQPFSPA